MPLSAPDDTANVASYSQTFPFLQADWSYSEYPNQGGSCRWTATAGGVSGCCTLRAGTCACSTGDLFLRSDCVRLESHDARSTQASNATVKAFCVVFDSAKPNSRSSCAARLFGSFVKWRTMILIWWNSGVMDKFHAIANALNPSYKSSLNIAQMRKDWRKCRMKK